MEIEMHTLICVGYGRHILSGLTLRQVVVLTWRLTRKGYDVTYVA